MEIGWSRRTVVPRLLNDQRSVFEASLEASRRCDKTFSPVVVVVVHLDVLNRAMGIDRDAGIARFKMADSHGAIRLIALLML